MRSYEVTLVVDPTLCDGHGVCAELVPEAVTLDRFGFPVIDRAPLAQATLEHAEKAVRSCPKLALHLLERSVG